MRARKLAKSAVLAFSVVVLFEACGTPPTVKQDTTNSLLTVVSIVPSNSSNNDLQSDVCDNPVATPFAGGTLPTCTAINDIATVSLLNRSKGVVSSLGPSQFQDVVLTRYRVTYIRSDGLNTPGVHVPFPFDGAANVQLPIGEQTSFEITVVRQSSKLESPLVNLAFNGGEIVLSNIAQIDFFGADLAGKAITVRGYINITFGDF